MSDLVLKLLIGLVVVGIVVFFWYNISEAGEDVTGALPDSVAAKAQVCKSAYVPVESVAGWCNPSETDNKEYMNCKYIQTKYNSELGDGYNPTCKNPEKTFCEKLKNEQEEKYATGKDYDPAKILVDGNTCVYWGVGVGDVSSTSAD